MSAGGAGILKRCVVVGGSGAVGGMFARLLRGSGAEVLVADTAGGDLVADVTAPDEEFAARLAEADMVMLAVPEDAALAGLPRLLPHLRPGALVVDTLSVKCQVVAALGESAGVEAVSLNPMFAPSLGMDGRPVAAVVVHDGPAAGELLRLLGEWGGRLVRLDAEGHDRLTAAAQVLTHASVLGFGLGLTELGVEAEELAAIAPPPHTTLLALLARIASGAPEVYWDIQAAHPDGAAARRALAAGVRRLADVVESGDETRFAAVLGELRDFLGAELTPLSGTCAGIFDGLSQAESTRNEAR